MDQDVALGVQTTVTQADLEGFKAAGRLGEVCGCLSGLAQSERWGLW